MNEKKKVIGNIYEERFGYQLEEWVKGNPIHNDIDNECCPDFSCCDRSLLMKEKDRIIYRNFHYAKLEVIKMFAEIARDKKISALNRCIPISPPTFKRLRKEGLIKDMLVVAGICKTLDITPNQLLGWETIEDV